MLLILITRRINIIKDQPKLVKKIHFFIPLEPLQLVVPTWGQLQMKQIIYQFVELSLLYRMVYKGKRLAEKTIEMHQDYVRSIVIFLYIRNSFPIPLISGQPRNEMNYISVCRAFFPLSNGI
jgi:hypothetical protein